EGQSAVLELVLHLVPQGGLAERYLNAASHVVFDPVEPQPEGHVLEYAHRERVRLLKHHADVTSRRASWTWASSSPTCTTTQPRDAASSEKLGHTRTCAPSSPCIPNPSHWWRARVPESRLSPTSGASASLVREHPGDDYRVQSATRPDEGVLRGQARREHPLLRLHHHPRRTLSRQPAAHPD